MRKRLARGVKNATRSGWRRVSNGVRACRKPGRATGRWCGRWLFALVCLIASPLVALAAVASMLWMDTAAVAPPRRTYWRACALGCVCLVLLGTTEFVLSMVDASLLNDPRKATFEPLSEFFFVPDFDKYADDRKEAATMTVNFSVALLQLASGLIGVIGAVTQVVAMKSKRLKRNRPCRRGYFVATIASISFFTLSLVAGGMCVKFIRTAVIDPEWKDLPGRKPGDNPPPLSAGRWHFAAARSAVNAQSIAGLTGILLSTVAGGFFLIAQRYKPATGSEPTPAKTAIGSEAGLSRSGTPTDPTPPLVLDWRVTAAAQLREFITDRPEHKGRLQPVLELLESAR